MKMSEQAMRTKSTTKTAKKTRKPYITPKLTVLGKIERLTAGSGSKPMCIMTF